MYTFRSIFYSIVWALGVPIFTLLVLYYHDVPKMARYKQVCFPFLCVLECVACGSCLNKFMFVHIHVYMTVYFGDFFIHIYRYTRKRVHTHTTYTHTRTYTHTHTDIHAHMHTHVHTPIIHTCTICYTYQNADSRVGQLHDRRLHEPGRQRFKCPHLGYLPGIHLLHVARLKRV